MGGGEFGMKLIYFPNITTVSSKFFFFLLFYFLVFFRYWKWLPWSNRMISICVMNTTIEIKHAPVRTNKKYSLCFCSRDSYSTKWGVQMCNITFWGWQIDYYIFNNKIYMHAQPLIYTCVFVVQCLVHYNFLRSIVEYILVYGHNNSNGHVYLKKKN